VAIPASGDDLVFPSVTFTGGNAAATVVQTACQ